MNTHTNISKKIGLATAATAVSSANAQTVQITLPNNFVSSQGIDNLYGDLTGDGNEDLIGLNGRYQLSWRAYFGNATTTSHRFAGSTSGIHALAQYNVNRNSHTHIVEMWYGTGIPGTVNTFIRNTSGFTSEFLLPILFKDTRINGGSATDSWVHIILDSSSPTDQSITLSRIIFDESTASSPTANINTTYTEWTPVPEPSSLALLALGAGGLLTRRKRSNN